MTELGRQTIAREIEKLESEITHNEMMLAGLEERAKGIRWLLIIGIVGMAAGAASLFSGDAVIAWIGASLIATCLLITIAVLLRRVDVNAAVRNKRAEIASAKEKLAEQSTAVER